MGVQIAQQEAEVGEFVYPVRRRRGYDARRPPPPPVRGGGPARRLAAACRPLMPTAFQNAASPRPHAASTSKPIYRFPISPTITGPRSPPEQPRADHHAGAIAVRGCTPDCSFRRAAAKHQCHSEVVGRPRRVRRRASTQLRAEDSRSSSTIFRARTSMDPRGGKPRYAGWRSEAPCPSAFRCQLSLGSGADHAMRPQAPRGTASAPP